MHKYVQVKRISKDTTQPINKYISPWFDIKPGTKKTEMSLKCRKIFPTENIMISFNPDDLTGSSKASTKVKLFSSSDQKSKL